MLDEGVPVVGGWDEGEGCCVTEGEEEDGVDGEEVEEDGEEVEDGDVCEVGSVGDGVGPEGLWRS